MKQSTRRALHAHLTPASHERWHDIAAELGTSVSSLLEVIGLHLTSESEVGLIGNGVDLSALAREARRIDAQRRRRSINLNSN